MKVNYDPESKRVIVAFRGRITVLPDPVDGEAAALKVGEAYCREHGWTPDRKNGGRKIRSAW